MLKLSVPCMECSKEFKYPEFTFYNFQFNDNLAFQLECKHGHKAIVVLQNEKFEVLFDLACKYYIDGDYSASAFYTAAAIERFYEYFCKVLAVHNKVPWDVLDPTWKIVSKRSEQQIGAFYLNYMMEFHVVPPKIDNNLTKFRNNVVHNGCIATKDKTEQYIKFAYQHIKELLAKIKLNERYTEDLINVSFHSMEQRNRPLNNANLPIATFSAPSVLGLIDGESNWAEKTFEQSLEDLKKREEMDEFIRNTHGPIGK